MNDLEPARRFYQATLRAARAAGLAGHVPALLVRFGLPGLMSRIEVDPPVTLDPALFRVQQLRHALLEEQALRVAASLSAAGVQHFFAKGVALLGRPYRPGDRLLADMDVYVRPDDRERATRVLESLLYRRLPEWDQAGPASMRSTLALERESAHTIERCTVDLHWALDPVERILPRRDRPVPERVWRSLQTGGPLTRPHPEHHAAILVHHLVHTDLLHVRGLLDLAFVFQEMRADAGGEYLATCALLRVGRCAAELAHLVARDLGVVRPGAMTEGAAPKLTLEGWLTLVAQSRPDDDGAMTVARLHRRLRLVDRGGLPTLGADLLFPPAAFLRWRWPGRNLLDATLRHYRQLARKALARRMPVGQRE
jgi:hypothetical protein